MEREEPDAVVVTLAMTRGGVREEVRIEGLDALFALWHETAGSYWRKYRQEKAREKEEEEEQARERQARMDAATRRVIHATLKEQRHPLSTGEMVELTGLKPSAITRHLNDMVIEGMVSETTYKTPGAVGRPHKAWTLVPTVFDGL